MSDEALHTKYRPTNVNEFIGQHSVIKSFCNVLDKGTSRAFVFAGPSGVGKTTLARIGAADAGCAPSDLIEIDAATNTGVDAMRRIAEAISYRPMAGKVKACIVDECHRLSGNAWDSLLKVVEEPPKHALWFFCTTLPTKLPATLKTRCAWYTLKALTEKEIYNLLDDVIGAERMKISDDIVDLIVRTSAGSPRQALTSLATCATAKDVREAAQLLQTAIETDASIELCRKMFKPGTWMAISPTIKRLENDNPEGVRILVCNYFAKVALNAKSERDAKWALHVIDSFSIPYNQAEGMAPLYLSVARVMWPPR